MRCLAVLVALLALGLSAPAVQADLISTGTTDVRLRDGHALAEGSDGAWRVWDLGKGRLGPAHGLRCGPSRLLDWGRDAGSRGSAYVAVTLERLEQARDEQGNLVGPPVPPPKGPEDTLCKPARVALDPDGDGRSAPGAVTVLRLTDLGRKAIPLPVIDLAGGQAPSGLWVVGHDVWLGLEGGARYVRLRKGATAWDPAVAAAARPAAVDPEQTGGVRLLDDGSLWRWSWSELARRATVRVAKGTRVRFTRRPRTTFKVTNPTPGYKPAEPGACKSPNRVTTGGPATALVDGRGRTGWGVSDGAITWRCKAGPDGTYERLDVPWLLRTADGGRKWRIVGRHPVQAPLVGLLKGQPVFEQGASDCPRPLVVRRGGSLARVACSPV